MDFLWKELYWFPNDKSSLKTIFYFNWYHSTERVLILYCDLGHKKEKLNQDFFINILNLEGDTFFFILFC